MKNGIPMQQTMGEFSPIFFNQKKTLLSGYEYDMTIYATIKKDGSIHVKQIYHYLTPEIEKEYTLSGKTEKVVKEQFKRKIEVLFINARNRNNNHFSVICYITYHPSQEHLKDFVKAMESYIDRNFKTTFKIGSIQEGDDEYKWVDNISITIDEKGVCSYKSEITKKNYESEHIQDIIDIIKKRFKDEPQQQINCYISVHINQSTNNIEAFKLLETIYKKRFIIIAITYFGNEEESGEGNGDDDGNEEEIIDVEIIEDNPSQEEENENNGNDNNNEDDSNNENDEQGIINIEKQKIILKIILNSNNSLDVSIKEDNHLDNYHFNDKNHFLTNLQYNLNETEIYFYLSYYYKAELDALDLKAELIKRGFILGMINEFGRNNGNINQTNQTNQENNANSSFLNTPVNVTTRIWFQGINNPVCFINVPDRSCPRLTRARRKVINIKFLEFFNNKKITDNHLYRLIYTTLQYMPFEVIGDAVSKALWYMDDYQILYYKEEIPLILLVFVEQREAFEDWLKANNINAEHFNLFLHYENIEDGIKRIIIKQNTQRIFGEVSLEKTTKVVILIAGLITIFKFLFKRKKKGKQ